MSTPLRIPPGPGQESVWDYPRPPRLEPFPGHVRILFAGQVLADTRRALRLLETSHPPTYYLPPEDVRADLLVPSERRSGCEWKGEARYVTVRRGAREAPDAGWLYPHPTGAYAALAGHLAFYAGPMDACLVDGERVTPQPGGFYGGWVTSRVAGPFKGAPGTRHW
jgi:uncharacterized protein (DUF427 family)